MVPLEALELALGKELQSIEMYQKFSEDYPVAQDTFLFLLQEEHKHKRLIEQKIVELKKG